MAVKRLTWFYAAIIVGCVSAVGIVDYSFGAAAVVLAAAVAGFFMGATNVLGYVHGNGRLPWPNCTMCGKPGDVVRGLGYAVCQNVECPDFGIGIHDDYGGGD